MSIAKTTMSILGLAALATSAQAAITGTFVAAQDGVNSFQSTLASNPNPGGVFSNTTNTQYYWQDRSAGVFNIVGINPSGGYQGQNRAGTTNNPTSNEVMTTISGLTAGIDYDIYIIFGISTSATSGTQHIDAGFTSGSLTTFTEGGATLTGDALGAGGPWVAAESLIGTTTADASGEINVFVSATNGAERTVYNGVSYVAVPEPSTTMALLGLGALAFVSSRRRS
jgi:hypothetical protein